MVTAQDLFDIIKRLRGENGCKWDRQQTAETMWKCLAEEVYELEQAILQKDRKNICEELGDTLFQLLFIIEIYAEKKSFTYSDVIEQIAAKMIRRHPHVYGDAVVNSKKELDLQWDRIKAQEKSAPKDGGDNSVLDRIPPGMPGLLRALKVSKAVVKEGFDWDDTGQVLQTVREELDEFEDALENGGIDEKMLEFGDILFTMVNVARSSGFHPETALSKATAKFEGRYRLLEKALREKDLKLDQLSRPQKEELWQNAKKAYDR